MKVKLAVFDLDGTLACVGEPVLEKNVELLKKIRETGCRVALCSGKPVYYLCGLARQLGIRDMILIGENGGTIQFGVELPPEQYYELPCSKEAQESIRYLRQRIKREIPGIYFQPGQIMLTPFPADEEEKEKIKDIFQKEKENIKAVTIYEHADSFDIVPECIHKGRGLEYLCSLMEIDPENVLAAGDGVNDRPMFHFAGLAVGVNVDKNTKVHKNLKNTESMLKYILEKLLNN